MKNILLVGLYKGPGSFGGVANYNNLLMDNFPVDKCKLFYFSLGKSPNWYSGPQKLSKVKYYIQHLFKIIEYISVICKKQIDIVQLQPTFTRLDILRIGFFSFLAKALGRKTVFFIRGWKKDEERKIFSSFIYFFILKHLLLLQDRIGVLSSEYKKILQDKLSLNNVFLSSTMVDTAKYNPSVKTFDKPYKVLFCGSMFKEKGIFDLLGAIPLVLKYEGDTKFVFMGDGPKLKSLKMLAKKWGIQNNVIFTGHLEGENKRKYFNESHILALLSHSEGFPNVVCEAMASGLAILATRTGAIPDVVEQGKNGYLIDKIPAKPIDISKKILEIINNSEISHDIYQNNIFKSKSKYDCKVVSKDIEQIYLSLY